jgi:hypothetical protein
MPRGDLAQYSADAASMESDEGDEGGLDAAIVDTPETGAPSVVASGADEDGMAAMAQTAAVEALAEGEVASHEGQPKIGYVPLPRMKPRDVLTMASAAETLGDNINVVPANAPPENNAFKKKPSPVAGVAALASLPADGSAIDAALDEATIDDNASSDLVSYAAGKGSFAEVREMTIEESPLYQPELSTASFESSDGFFSTLLSRINIFQKEDRLASSMKADLQSVMPQVAVLGADGEGVVGHKPLLAADGKGDMLVVNREGKGNLPPMKLRLSQAVSAEDEQQ